MKNTVKYVLVLLGVVLADQGAKLWVYSNMALGPAGHIKIFGNLFKLTYVLNYGMAFGLQFGFKYGKLCITFIRIGAAMCIAFYVARGLARSAPSVWAWGWILILGGAIGNSIDSVFYGVYLDNAPGTAPMKWFHGQVIDMLHVDFWSGVMPNWLPIWGGQEICVLPIFNIADVAIFIGLLFVFCFCDQMFSWKSNNEAADLLE